MKNRWLALIFVVALMPMVLPLLVEPGSPIDVMLQSSIWVVAGGTTIILTALAWLGNRARAVSDPNERLAMTGLFFMRELPLLVMFGFGIYSLNELHSGHALRDLHRHGQRATADVLEIYTDLCGRSGCTIQAKYRFTPAIGAGSGSPVIGHGYLGNSRDSDDANLLAAKRNRKVPVVYEIGKPANSTLNFGDRVFVRDPISLSYSIIEGMGEVQVSVIAGLVCVGWYFRRRARSGGILNDRGPRRT